jgi:hypothetical protein
MVAALNPTATTQGSPAVSALLTPRATGRPGVGQRRKPMSALGQLDGVGLPNGPEPVLSSADLTQLVVFMPTTVQNLLPGDALVAHFRVSRPRVAGTFLQTAGRH